VPACVLDVNVWLAAGFEAHPAHQAARRVLMAASDQDPAVWCRSTQQSFLRLASNPVVLQAYAVPRATNREAGMALESFMALPQVDLADEPPDLWTIWCRLGSVGQAAPKLWMDAYLAAFAIAGGYRLISLDQDFRQFIAAGLTLELLEVKQGNHPQP
jgi:uncharacterized protein